MGGTAICAVPPIVFYNQRQMSLRFEIHRTENSMRRATLHLPHGSVETPVFMPVGTAASVKAVPQDILETLGDDGRGAEIILANTYHLYLRPGHELIRRAGGVHKFMSWNRPMLTDSGGFQVFSLAALRKITAEGVEFRSHLDGSKHFFSPEHSIDVQIALGADIIMAFDECTEHPATYERTRDSMALTHAWAQRSLDHFHSHCQDVPWFNELGQRQNLYGIVQGGMYKDLRTESANRLLEMRAPNGEGFDGYAIGGLAVGEPREVTREIIAHTLELLPKDKPRYVMGVGYPDEIVEYAQMGVDQMDCVLPTRAARHALLFTSEGRLNIRGKKFSEDHGQADPECHCPVCRRYSRAYLRHLFHTGEPLAATLASVHNLSFYLDTMRKLRGERIAG
ncbi:tRNA-guanine transglycosylase [Terriglobus roseus]|uniref:Queuine tRNA-ribosyltransferase n=2 Tax=Terriglobus roseus TaxID=392734 RepID=A0A1G7PH85_9BACT|nr:tRNA-guanine transglycosylase [Terriglobus roseus]